MRQGLPYAYTKHSCGNAADRVTTFYQIWVPGLTSIDQRTRQHSQLEGFPGDLVFSGICKRLLSCNQAKRSPGHEYRVGACRGHNGLQRAERTS